MNIPEAIEILANFHDQAASTFDATSANAFQLGIEALQIIEWLRHERDDPLAFGLPSETLEEEQPK